MRYEIDADASASDDSLLGAGTSRFAKSCRQLRALHAIVSAGNDGAASTIFVTLFRGAAEIEPSLSCRH